MTVSLNIADSIATVDQSGLNYVINVASASNAYFKIRWYPKYVTCANASNYIAEKGLR